MGAEHVVADQLTGVVVVMVLHAMCGLVRCWVAFRLAMRQEAEATYRLDLLAGRAPATRRAEILRAYAELGRATPVPSAREDQDQRRGDLRVGACDDVAAHGRP
jgi:hypothetical protein